MISVRIGSSSTKCNGFCPRIAKIRTAVKEPAKMPTRKLPAGRQIGNATQPAHRVGVGEAAADYLRKPART